MCLQLANAGLIDLDSAALSCVGDVMSVFGANVSYSSG